MSQVLTPELKSEFLGLISQTRDEFAKQTEEKTRGIIDPIREEVMRKLDERIDAIEAKIRAPHTPADQKATDERVTQLFGEYCRKGQGFRTPEDAPAEWKNILANVDPQGGYLMPAATEGRIVAKVYDTTPMRQYATVEQLNGDKLEGLIDNGQADSGWVSEQGARTETNTPELGKYSLEVHEQYARAHVSQKSLDDMANVESWLVGKLSDRFTRVENASFFNGTGIGQPRGLCTYTTAATADSTRAWGTIEHVNTGAAGAFAASNPADTLIDVIYQIKSAYRAGAMWMAPKDVYRLVRKFKTTSDAPYIWEPAFGADQPARVLGYPIVEAEDMPVLANGSLSMAFGNFREAYTIVDRLGMRMIRDIYSSKPFVQFYAIKRTGGGVVNFEAVKFVRFGS